MGNEKMSVEIIKRADIVASVPKRWDQTYANYNDPRKSEITRKLHSLPLGFTVEQVNEIIGNKTWTVNPCDECGADCDVLVRIGDRPDHDARWVDLCAKCLAVATAALSQEKSNG